MKIHKHVSLIIIISALLFVRAYSQQYQPTNVAVTTSGAQSETAIAVDPNHPNHLMATWNDFTNSQA